MTSITNITKLNSSWNFLNPINLMPMMTLFRYKDYKKYVADTLKIRGPSRGARGRLAKALSCHSGFISQVLNGHCHFSLEHAVIINRFFSHNEDDSDFFIFLVQYQRAGTPALRKYFKNKMDAISLIHENVTKKLGKTKEIEHPADQLKYYSSWHFDAIKSLCQIPRYKTPRQMAAKLRLPIATVVDALNFLESMGLVSSRQGNYSADSDTDIICQIGSPLGVRYGTDRRLKTIESLSWRSPQDLHHTGFHSLTKADAETLRSMLLDFIELKSKMLRKPRTDDLYGVSIDLYRFTSNEDE